jgi:phosphoglycerate kinase
LITAEILPSVPRAVARALTDGEAFTVIGGGDTGAAIRALGLAEDAFG